MASRAETRTHRVLSFARRPFKNKTLRRVLLIGALLFLFPWFVAFYLVCGALDVIRNRNLDWPLVRKYFLGHGALTWYLSPFNLLMDVLTLPYWNKGVYELKDLPKAYQDELTALIETIKTKDIVGQLEDKLKSHEREMIFFKWYGHNLDNVINFPEFHEKYKYIRTIGISVFNKRMSTSKHFGPFRMSLRVLYNINTITSDQVYIEVGDRRNYWRESKLFIFDDTLLHQSVNESDARRYCAFIDIMRPSLIAPLMSVIVYVFGWLFMKMNRIFYNGWEFVK